MKASIIHLIPDFSTDLKVSSVEYLLLCIIQNFSKNGKNSSDGYYGTMSGLCKLCGKSDDTVRTALKNLVEKGFLEVESYVGEKNTFYTTPLFSDYYTSKGEKKPFKTDNSTSNSRKIRDYRGKTSIKNPENSGHNNIYNIKPNNKRIVKIENRTPEKSRSNFSFISGTKFINEQVFIFFERHQIITYQFAEEVMNHLLKEFHGQKNENKELFRSELEKANMESLQDFIDITLLKINKSLLSKEEDDYCIEEESQKVQEEEIDSIPEYVQMASDYLIRALLRNERINIPQILSKLRSIDDQYEQFVEE